MRDDSRQASPARRQLLRGAAAAGLVAAAVAVEQIARPAPAVAANGDSLVLGAVNDDSAFTEIDDTATSNWAFIVDFTDPGNGLIVQSEGAGGGTAFWAQANGAGTGVVGQSSGSGIGVSAFSDSHWAVSATSNQDTAVQAQSKGGVGVVGIGTTTGVYGQSGSTDGFAQTRDGIRGFTDSANDSGVRGENASGGHGVSGTTASTGRAGRAAVDGANSSTGPGVRGIGGIGVLAQASRSGATALAVQGPAVFSRSGTMTVAAGHSSATVTRVALSAASLVLATLQQHHTGVCVLAAVPEVSRGSFTVYLSKTVTAPAKVAWFVVN